MGEHLVGMVDEFSCGGAAILEVRRVRKDEVKTLRASIEIQKAHGVHLLDASPKSIESGGLEVFPDESGSLAMMFYEDCGYGSPAESLDAQCAASGVEVKDAGFRDAFSERGKNGASNPVHGGTGAFAGGLNGESAC